MFDVLGSVNGLNARMGVLTLPNEKKLETPALFLSYSFRRGNPRPWDPTHKYSVKYGKVDMECLLVNAFDIFTSRVAKDIEKVGIHSFLNCERGIVILMDSGGFQFLSRKNITITPDQILSLYKKVKPDIGVVLDYPLNRAAPLEEQRKCIEKTLENTQWMFNNAKTIKLLPVMHIYDVNPSVVQKDIKRLLDLLSSITEEENIDTIGVGSLVPVIFGTRGIKGRYKLLLKIISAIRQIIPNKLLHVFGVGSALTLHILFSMGVDSADSTAWIHKARYGKIQLPGMGEIFVIKRVTHRHEKEVDWETYNCNCPVCKNLERREDLASYGIFGLQLRATHNAYVYIQEVKKAREAMKKGEYVDFIRERLNATGLKAHFEYIYSEMLNSF